MSTADALMRDPTIRSKVAKLERISMSKRLVQSQVTKLGRTQDQLITELVEAGMPLRYLATIAGLSHTTIGEIAKKDG